MALRLCLCPLIMLLTSAYPVLAEPLVIGVAKGFPPYQFEQNGAPGGFDVDVAKAVAEELDMDIRFHQDAWDNVVGMLRLGEIDCAAGMEINPFRDRLFIFTTPYTTRHNAVFVLENSPINGVEDMYGQIITGDRHSFVELYWREQGIFNKIRVSQTATKAQAMKQLADGHSAAAIMPLQVGRHLARENDLKVRVVLHPDPGSDVGFAFTPRHDDLRLRFDHALDTLRRNGKLRALEQAWFEED